MNLRFWDWKKELEAVVPFPAQKSRARFSWGPAKRSTEKQIARVIETTRANFCSSRSR